MRRFGVVGEALRAERPPKLRRDAFVRRRDLPRLSLFFGDRVEIIGRVVTGGDEAREPRRERHDALDDVGDALEVEEALRGDAREARAERRCALETSSGAARIRTSISACDASITSTCRYVRRLFSRKRAKLWHAANLRRRSSSPRLRSSSHASSSAASTRLSLNAYWNMRLYRAIASRVTTSPSGHGTRYSSSSASHPSRLGTRNDAEAALASDDDDDGEDALVAPVASRAGSNLGLNLAASGSCSALDFIAALWNRASSSRSAVAGRGGRARSPPASSKNC